MGSSISSDFLVNALLDYKYVRQILKGASKHASWWELLWLDPVSRLVRRIKQEQEEQLQQAFESCHADGLPISFYLRLGYVNILRCVVLHELDFSTPGRLVASLAFMSYLIDRWAEDSDFSFDFVLDSTAIPLWQMSRYYASTSADRSPPPTER